MAEKYSNARARKSRKNIEVGEISNRDKKKIQKVIKKSSILVVSLLFLIIGLVGGYFAFSYLSHFEMNSFVVNGKASEEVDYVTIDTSAIKEELEKDGTSVTIEKLFSSIKMEDKGVKCSVFGIDLSNTVSTKYYYREDISFDAMEVDKIDLQTAGVYYVEYTSSHFLYKSKKLIRTIVVTGVEIDG